MNIATTTTRMVYLDTAPCCATMKSGKGKYKSDIHGAIVDLREGGESGVGEAQPAVYSGVFIEIRRKRRMKVSED